MSSRSSRFSSDATTSDAVDAHDRVAADLDVQVGRAAGDGGLQQIVDVHGDGTPNSADSALTTGRPQRPRLRAPPVCERLARVHERQPAVAVGRLAVDDCEERLLDGLGDRAAAAAADR